MRASQMHESQRTQPIQDETKDERGKDQAGCSVLDIGSSKIAALIGEPNAEDVRVLGVGVAPACGIKAGCIVDAEAASVAVRSAIQTAEQMSSTCFGHPALIIGGEQISFRQSSGMTLVEGGKVGEDDIARAIAAARALPMPADEAIINSLIVGFTLDRQEGVKTPLGMAAHRITAHISLISADMSYLTNLRECVERTGYSIATFMPQAVAASYATLNVDEKEDGVCLLAMGHATSDMAIYIDGELAFLSSYPIGGAAISAAIADGLSIPLFQADEYKSRLDFSNPFLCGAGGKAEAITRSLFVQLADSIQDDISAQGLRRGLRRGIVLTGGISSIPGIDGVIAHRLHCQARMSKPSMAAHRSDILSSPAMAACIGALARQKIAAGS